jgi:hypothetical protein
LHLAGKIVACPRCQKALRVPERPGESCEVHSATAAVVPVSSEEFWADQVPVAETVRPRRLVDAYRGGGWKADAERSGQRPAYLRYLLGAAGVLALALMVWTGRQIYIAANGVSGPILGGLLGGVAWNRKSLGDIFEASFPGGVGPRENAFTAATFVGKLEGRQWLLRDPEASYRVVLLTADRDALPGSPEDDELAEIVANSMLVSLGAAQIKASGSSWRSQPAARASGVFTQAGEPTFIDLQTVVLLDHILVQQWTTPAANQERYAPLRDRFFESLRFYDP